MKNFLKTSLLCFITTIPFTGWSKTPKIETYQPCLQDAKRYKERSDEIQRIVEEDQRDRTSNTINTDVQLRDRKRRMRLGEIFGEGCFKSAADFGNAALVYQHGDQPYHFFQAFIWAKEAVDLGDHSKKRLSALAIDRYLVKSGHKQIFASQAYRGPNETCWCLEQVERSFPETMRTEFMGTSLKEQENWIQKLNKSKKCPVPHYCEKKLKPTPKGSIAGFW